MCSKKKISAVLCAVVLSQIVNGCVPIIAGGAAVTGTTVIQERTVGAAMDDTTIWAEIKHLYIQKDVNSLLSDVSVKVNIGRVLLTGNVRDSQTRVEAVRLAWQPYGVKEVINEIRVTDKSTAKDYATDAWITTQSRSKILLQRDVRSVNYSLETVDGVVFVFGIARSQEELDTVVHVVSTIKGVKQVVSHVRIKDNTAPRV